MIWTLFKTNFKNNRFILLLMTFVFCFYVAIILTMFDPNSIEALNDMIKALPETMVKAMNFEALGNTLFTYISGYLYGFLVFLFPMVLTVVVNHRLIASLVDKGSMSYLLATPHTRVKIALAQILFSVFTSVFIFSVTTLFTLAICTALFPSELEVGKLILLNLYAMVLYFAISSICFLGSVLANESKTSLSIGVGFPVTFLILQMIGDAGDKFSWVSHFSLYALFDPDLVARGSNDLWLYMAALMVLAITLYGLSIRLFKKKDLFL